MVEHFIQESSIHSYGTRFRETGCFSIPTVKRFGKKYFVYNGCVLWNELPGDIRNLQRYQNFKVQSTLITSNSKGLDNSSRLPNHDIWLQFSDEINHV